MKKIILTALIAVAAISANAQDNKTNIANVEQQRGIYIFMLSKPTAEYTYLGSVKKLLYWTGQPEEMLVAILKKIKKDYPEADGVIFTSLNMDRADAIKFK